MSENSVNYAKITLKCLPATGEWVVRLWDINGRRLADADYYTDSKEDALATKATLEKALAGARPTDQRTEKHT